MYRVELKGRGRRRHHRIPTLFLMYRVELKEQSVSFNGYPQPRS